MLALLRIVVFIFTLLIFVSIFLPLNALFSLSFETRFRIRSLFCQLAMIIYGVKLKIQGQAVHHQGPFLIVCNHRSLLDPVICARYFHAFFLSKAEVKSYPLIGAGSRLTGVIFVRRDDKTSRKMSREGIKNVLQSGFNVMVYPEGTTNDKPLTKQFYKGTFEIASELNIAVIPVILEYKDRNDYWTSGGLWMKSIEQFSKWHTAMHLWIGEPIKADDPLELMENTRMLMDKKIREVQEEWGNWKE